MVRNAARLGPALLLTVAGCSTLSTSAAAPDACLLPTEQRMVVAELFFGRAIDRRLSTAAEWAGFAAEVITPNFPDGFTTFDGEGQWRNPQTGVIVTVPTKILLIAARREPDVSRRLSVVIEAYKMRFHQQSVGLITRDSCAAFS